MSSGWPMRRSGRRPAIVLDLVVEVRPVDVGERGLHQARGERVDPDPGRPEVHRQRAHQRLHPALHRAVARVARRPHLRELAADQHDRPTAPGHHLPQARPRQPERRVQVDIPHQRPLLVGRAADVLAPAHDPGRVDQPVQPPEPADRRGRAPVGGAGFGEVGGMHRDGRGLLRELREACLAAARGQHVRALEGAPPRDRPPDPGRGPGHQDGAPFESFPWAL